MVSVNFQRDLGDNQDALEPEFIFTKQNIVCMQAAVVARAHASGLGFGFSQFAVFSVYALAFWYGGQLMRAGQMDFAQVLKVSRLFSLFSSSKRLHVVF